jgi:hypothetical protein
MVRLISALILVLLIATPTLGQQSLVGTYKLVSTVIEVDGTPSQHMGNAPHGYLVLTPTRLIFFITADNRKFGTSVAEKAALFDTLAGYAGLYRIEGDKLIFTAEVLWTESFPKTNSVDTWQLSGNRLTLTYGPLPYPRDPSKTVIRRQVWEKIE